MMNDRFSAELRQHLLATADERPADGRLAAIVDGVAVTTQRHPLTARLTWAPRRLGPFPSAAVRYGLIAAALLIAVVAAALFAGGQPRRTVFEGTWTSIDPADGSTQLLVVGAGASPTVHFEDQFATGAACVADEVKVFTADGSGEISDDRLDASFPDGGGCGLMSVDIALRLVYDAGTNSLRDQDGLGWSRVEEGDRPATQSPTTESSQSPSTSPRPGETTFRSTIHGISIDYPSGWQTRPATEPWTGGELNFDSPAADVIFDPTLGDRLYLLLASQPYGGLSQDAWRGGVLAWTCPEYDGGEMWSRSVDGARSWQQAPCNSGSIIDRDTRSGSIIVTDTRGYLIRLVASTNEPGLADTYDWDWLMPVLETVDLRPEEALDDEPATPGPATQPSTPSPSLAAATPDSDCIELKSGDTYRGTAGSLSLTATLPAGAGSWEAEAARQGLEPSWWHGGYGLGDAFSLGNRHCSFGSDVTLSASLLREVYADDCAWRGTGVAVMTPAAAVAELAGQPALAGQEVSGPDDVTIGGYQAKRFHISLPVDFDATGCSDGIVRVWQSDSGLDDGTIGAGQSKTVYVVDVDGVPLGFTISSWSEAETPAMLEEIAAIIASLRIEP